jgi:hypothetical protein
MRALLTAAIHSRQNIREIAAESVEGASTTLRNSGAIPGELNASIALGSGRLSSRHQTAQSELLGDTIQWRVLAGSSGSVLRPFDTEADARVRTFLLLSAVRAAEPMNRCHWQRGVRPLRRSDISLAA